MERWAQFGEPTPYARLAQARAFVDLRLMDRASIRLMELVENEHVQLEALRLAARMYLLRGWPTKARKSLQQALAEAPDDDELQELWEQANQPARQPDPSDEDGPPDEALGVAEAYIATGSFIRAQTLLERLKRQLPDNPRVDDLRWALAGDFSVDEPLDELTQQWAPEIQLGDFPDDAEHTESIDADDAAVDAPDPHGSSAFPSLFRSPTSVRVAPDDDDDDDGDEITHHSSMASLSQLQDDLDSASPEAPTTIESHDDTQILMVIRREGGGSETRPVSGRIHDGLPLPTPQDFDLEAFRRKMGVAPKLYSDFDPELEEEDDDLIILTGKERTESDRPEPPGSLPLEPDPTDSDVDPDLADKIRAQANEAASGAPRPRRRRRTRHDASPWWLLILAGLVLLAMASLFGLTLLKLLLG